MSKKLITKISWHKINKSVKQDKCKQYGRNNDIYYIDVRRILRFPSEINTGISLCEIKVHNSLRRRSTNVTIKHIIEPPPIKNKFLF